MLIFSSFHTVWIVCEKSIVSLFHSKIFLLVAVFVNIVVARAYAALFNSGCSFSGFNQTFSGNSQFLISLTCPR